MAPTGGCHIEEDAVTTPDEPTRPSDRTRATEDEDARTPARADREPTSDEENVADRLELDPEVTKHYEEMTERGANQEGEGRVP
jgi:hypothetical protein